MSKIISTNKLNRFWVNGIKPTTDKVKNTIKDRSSLMSNTEENKLVDALAIKEALNYQNISNKTNKQYATLEDFVTDTATDVDIPHVGRCKDISSNGWLEKAPFNYGNHWYRYVITYQSHYVAGSSSSIYGNGIFWNQMGRMFNVLIEGNKDTGLTVTHQVLNIPPIKTKQDLMANKVSGLFPDALAVKDGFEEIKNSLVKYNSNIHIVSDLLEEADKGPDSIFIVEYSGSTANTPYTAGLSGTAQAGIALICMTGVNYGQIIAFTAGNNQIFNRHKNDNGWSDWDEVNPQMNNAGSHNCVYRGRHLGNSVSESQYAAIAAGTFNNMYIGDYWTINNVTYRIAAFDYYYNTGNTACTKHHVVLVPDRSLYTHVMNDTDIVTGAYVGSKMYTEGLNQAKEIINTAFGASHVLSHRQYLYNTVNAGGFTTTGAWYDSTVELMNERNVYGTVFFSNQNNGTSVASNYTLDKSQYPLFAYRPDMISNRNGFWLRDVAFSERFCAVASDGMAGTSPSSTASGGVRPAFCIC